MKGAISSEGGIVLASWSQINHLVSKSDVVLHVLDVRDPLNTLSRKLVRMVEKRGKKLIIVLNKCDLVPRSVAEEWKEYFEKKFNHPTVYIAASKRMGTLKLRTAIKKEAPRLPAIVSVVGFPKVGKSSVINALKGKHSASTSPYPGSPGYTRHFQLYRVDPNILMIDTPGILPIEGDTLERLIRGYPPEKLEDPVLPAVMLIERILKYQPMAIKLAYGIDTQNPMEILEKIAVHRGWFYKTTKEPLIEEAARAVIRDYQAGKIPFYIRPSQVSS
ncbi:MAG: GTPase [Desulfurococcaceae archaeon]